MSRAEWITFGLRVLSGAVFGWYVGTTIALRIQVRHLRADFRALEQFTISVLKLTAGIKDETTDDETKH